MSETQNPTGRRIVCPKCGSAAEVIDSRPGPVLGDECSVRRRRACVACDHRWTTYEVSEDKIAHLMDMQRSLSTFAKYARDFANLVLKKETK